MYGIVLSIKESDYIVALRLADIKSYKIILKHLLPNSFPSMIVMFATNLGSAIMLESTLSFLGIGIQMPTASWGKHGVGWILLPVHQPYAGTASRCLYHADRGGL